MKTHVKCGLLTALGWNVLLLIAFLIRARLKEVSVSYFFDDGTGGWGITAPRWSGTVCCAVLWVALP